MSTRFTVKSPDGKLLGSATTEAAILRVADAKANLTGGPVHVTRNDKPWTTIHPTNTRKMPPNTRKMPPVDAS